MSLKQTDFSLRALVYNTLPFWFYTLLFFFTVTAIIFVYMRQQEEIKAGQLLSYYQAVYNRQGASALRFSFSAPKKDTGSFLRLEGAGLRLILVSNSGQNEIKSLPDLTRFSVSENHTWFSLQPRKYWGNWTVAATPLKDGNILQIGINSSASIKIFTGICSSLVPATLFFLLFSFIPAWLSAKKSRKTYKQLAQQITLLNRGEIQKIQPDSSLNPEEQHLIQVIDTLLSRHQQLTRELQESMDNVAHDLRTPMTRLRAIAEYGLHKNEDIHHLQEALADCLEESDRMLAMLNTMLNVAEAEADVVKLNIAPLDLAATIEGIIDLYDILAEEQNITINFTPEPDITILADSQRISQVWANLVDNAIKYNATEIDILTKKQDKTAQITISDNGMGISENELPRIWERLYRGDRSRSKPGLGLGLTLVRATVQNHNGTIAVSSTLNQGTAFTITLPLARQA